MTGFIVVALMLSSASIAGWNQGIILILFVIMGVAAVRHYHAVN